MRSNIDRLFMHIANQSRIHTISAYPFFKGDGSYAEDIFDEMVKASATPQTCLLQGSGVKSLSTKACQIWKKIIQKPVRDYTDAYDVLCELKTMKDGEEIAGKIIKNVFEDSTLEIPTYFVTGLDGRIETQQQMDEFSKLSMVIKDRDPRLCKKLLKEISFDDFMKYWQRHGEAGLWILTDVMMIDKGWINKALKSPMVPSIRHLAKLYGIFNSMQTQSTEVEQKEEDMTVVDQTKEVKCWIHNAETRMNTEGKKMAFALDFFTRAHYFLTLQKAVSDAAQFKQAYDVIKSKTYIPGGFTTGLTESFMTVLKLVAILYATQEDLRKLGLPAMMQYNHEEIDQIISTIIKGSAALEPKENKVEPLSISLDTMLKAFQHMLVNNPDMVKAAIAAVTEQDNKQKEVESVVANLDRKVREVGKISVNELMTQVQQAMNDYGYENVLKALVGIYPILANKPVSVDTVNIHFLKAITAQLESDKWVAQEQSVSNETTSGAEEHELCQCERCTYFMNKMKTMKGHILAIRV